MSGGAVGNPTARQERTEDESMQHYEGDGTTARMREQSRKVRDDLEELASTVMAARSEWETTLREHLTAHPYAGLAAAAGLGYVLGAGVSPALLRTIFGLGTRIALAMVVRELTAPLTAVAGESE